MSDQTLTEYRRDQAAKILLAQEEQKRRDAIHRLCVKWRETAPKAK